MSKRLSVFAASALSLTAISASAETLTIATVNNGDMIRMQTLVDDFTAKNPGITLNWVTLEENVLRQKLTTDIATKGGQFDVLTIGTYETPIWAKQGWLVPLDKLGADYDANDLLPAIKSAVSVDEKLYAAPFYGESSLLMYRKDLFEKAGLSMPTNPTWEFVAEAAHKINDPAAGVAGICLRGKPGWGENMALITTLANSMGARWFDDKWKPQFDQPIWKQTLSYYVNLMKEAGPQAGAASNGFNETLALFQQGHCGMWVDASVAASFLSDPKQSTVADKVAFAVPPSGPTGNHGNWLWAWNLAIPASSKKVEAAEAFISWATSKSYTELVARKEGWANVPPGTRTSLYENPKYTSAAPFAKMTLDAMNAANLAKPNTPYVFWQYVIIPQYQSIGANVGQTFSAALTGKISVDQALKDAQESTLREMTKAGYYK